MGWSVSDYPEPKPEKPEPVFCPVCGCETDVLIKDFWGDVVGCPGCVKYEDTDSV